MKGGPAGRKLPAGPLGSIHIVRRVDDLAVLGHGEVQVRAHAALGGGGAPHQADDVTGGHLIPLLHRRVLLQAAVLGGIAAAVLDHHGGAHQLVVLHRQHRAAGGSADGVPLRGLDVDAVVGAPVGHGLVIHQLRDAEHRYRGAVQRGHDLGQQVLGVGDGRLLRRRGGGDILLRLHRRGHPGVVPVIGDVGGGVGCGLCRGLGPQQGVIADNTGCQQAEGKGYVEALAAEHGLDLFSVESAHRCLSRPAWGRSRIYRPAAGRNPGERFCPQYGRAAADLYAGPQKMQKIRRRTALGFFLLWGKLPVLSPEGPEAVGGVRIYVIFFSIF